MTSTQKVKFPLGLKLAIIIGLIVLVSLMSVTFLNSYFVGEDVKITAEDNNLTLNTRSSETVQDKLETIRSNALQLLDIVLEGVRTIRKNNLLLTAAILFLSIAFILIFSRTAISRHLRKLTAAAGEIQKGNFNTDIITKLNTKRRDEIGVLNQSTKNEREFLNIFAKFTNQGVAKAIATKSIDFNKAVYPNNYRYSRIRAYLNGLSYTEKSGDTATSCGRRQFQARTSSRCRAARGICLKFAITV